MLLELWAKITDQKVVYLLDHDGEVTKTVAKLTPFGYRAKRHWPTSIKIVLLLPDGKIYGNSYVVAWSE